MGTQEPKGSYLQSQTEIKIKKSLQNQEYEDPGDNLPCSQDQDEAAAEEDFAKKAQQEELSQEVYTQLMKEMAHDSTSQTISHENLSLLLFMTQKAISDLKMLKSLFFNHNGPKFMRAGDSDDRRYRNPSQNYWQSLNQRVRLAIKPLPVNPLKLDKNLRNMISNAKESEESVEEEYPVDATALGRHNSSSAARASRNDGSSARPHEDENSDHAKRQRHKRSSSADRGAHRRDFGSRVRYHDARPARGHQHPRSSYQDRPHSYSRREISRSFAPKRYSSTFHRHSSNRVGDKRGAYDRHHQHYSRKKY